MNQSKPGEVRINVDLSDEDIYDAMEHVSGYVDITTEDFHEIYRLAFQHAVQRLAGSLSARDVMSRDVLSVQPEALLDEVARLMAERGVKGVPVVDGEGRVQGVITENDYLSHFGADTFIQFLVKFLHQSEAIDHALHETPAREFMSAPALTLPEEAAFAAIVDAFKRNPVSRIPIVDGQGRLAGIVTRRDFLNACHLQSME